MKIEKHNNFNLWTSTCSFVDSYTPSVISQTIKMVWEWSFSKKDIVEAQKRLWELHTCYCNLEGVPDEAVVIIRQLLEAGKVRAVVEPLLDGLWRKPATWEIGADFRMFHRILHGGLPRLRMRCDLLGLFNDAGVNFILYQFKLRHPELSHKLQACCLLQTLKERLLAFEDNQMAAFIVRFQGAHRTPLLVQRLKDSFRILITDSVETSTLIPYSSLIIEEIKKTKVPSAIFTYRGERPRQNDQHTCPVFAIQDVKRMAQYSDTIFETVKGFVEKKDNEEDVSGTPYLPSYMMEITQSLDMIQRYDDTFPPFSGPSICEEVQKDVLNDGDVVYNTKALRKYYKYYRMILADAFE